MNLSEIAFLYSEALSLLPEDEAEYKEFEVGEKLRIQAEKLLIEAVACLSMKPEFAYSRQSKKG